MAKMDEMNHRKQADEKRLDVLLRAIVGKKSPKDGAKAHLPTLGNK